MNGEEVHHLALSNDDIMTLCAGLTAYLRAFADHRAVDGGATHPEEEWQGLKTEVGQLLWRLEEAMAPPDADVIHSEDAVRPERGR